jgi:hypothetical protein
MGEANASANQTDRIDVMRLGANLGLDGCRPRDRAHGAGRRAGSPGMDVVERDRKSRHHRQTNEF